MRLSYGWVVGVLLVCAGGVGCGDQGKPQVDPKAIEAAAKEAAGIKTEESTVLERRDELQRERRKITDERASLMEKRKQVAASGGNVAEVDALETELATRESKLVDQETELNGRFESLFKKYEALAIAPPVAAGGGGAQADVARREGSLALREKDVATREARLAARETELAEREKSQARREKDTCGTATTTTIVQQVDAKGSKYTKRDVEPVLQKARRKANEKGLLASDLPAPAQGLEQEAVQAMKDGDYGKAKFAADQLYATVDSIKIDKAFISAKIGRLNAAMKGKALAGDPKKDADELFRGATADYGDGRFPSANGKLNKIYLLIR
jgi:uncharacterized protein (DUF3084 family)